MSLTTSINTLLSNHQKKISSLSEEEQSSLDNIRSNIRLGLVNEVVTSIKDYVTTNSSISKNISPGTVGSLLMGCLNKSGGMCHSPQPERNEEESIFIVDDEKGLSAIFISPNSTNANVYFTGEDTFLSQEEKESIQSLGIKKIKYYTLSDDSTFVLRNSEGEDEGSNNSLLEMKIPLFVIILAVCVFVYLYYEKFLH